MAACTDARLSTALPGHPKTLKLVRRLGPAGGWSLVCLFLWAAANRSDGDLKGFNNEDLEIAVHWQGEPGALVAALVVVGFLDGSEGAYTIHDWAEHNPWAAGAEARSEKSRFAALCKQHGRGEAARMMPEYASRFPEAGEYGGMSRGEAVPTRASGMPVAASGSAPSPSPLPTPFPQELQPSLRSDSHPRIELSGGGPAPLADLKAVRPTRIQQHALAAQEAYNRVLAKPRGHLVACQVLNNPRLKAVEKALPTARAICKQEYGSEHVVPEFWTALFNTAAEDGFHSGRGPYYPPHESWRPDFEYLLREGVIVKLFERALSAAVAGGEA